MITAMHPRLGFVQCLSGDEKPVFDWVTPLTEAEGKRRGRGAASEFYCGVLDCRETVHFRKGSESVGRRPCFVHPSGSNCLGVDMQQAASDAWRLHVVTHLFPEGGHGEVQIAHGVKIGAVRSDALVASPVLRVAVEAQRHFSNRDAVIRRLSEHASAGVDHTIWLLDVGRLGLSMEQQAELMSVRGPYLADAGLVEKESAKRFKDGRTGSWDIDSTNLGWAAKGAAVGNILAASVLSDQPTTIYLVGRMAASGEDDRKWAVRRLVEFSPMDPKDGPRWRMHTVGPGPVGQDRLLKTVTSAPETLARGWVPAWTVPKRVPHHVVVASDSATEVWTRTGAKPPGYDAMRAMGARVFDRPKYLVDNPCPCSLCADRRRNSLPDSHQRRVEAPAGLLADVRDSMRKAFFVESGTDDLLSRALEAARGEAGAWRLPEKTGSQGHLIDGPVGQEVIEGWAEVAEAGASRSDPARAGVIQQSNFLGVTPKIFEAILRHRGWTEIRRVGSEPKSYFFDPVS